MDQSAKLDNWFWGNLKSSTGFWGKFIRFIRYWILFSETPSTFTSALDIMKYANLLSTVEHGCIVLEATLYDYQTSKLSDKLQIVNCNHWNTDETWQLYNLYNLIYNYKTSLCYFQVPTPMTKSKHLIADGSDSFLFDRRHML